MLRRVRKTEEVARNGADVVVDDDGFVDVVVKWVFGFRHFVVSETVDVSFQPATAVDEHEQWAFTGGIGGEVNVEEVFFQGVVVVGDVVVEFGAWG